MSQDKFVAQVRSQLGMAISRLKILQNNHTSQAKTECRGVATMIEARKVERAKIRVENVIQLNQTTRFYELLERYCEILHARCMVMNLSPQRRQLLFNKNSASPHSKPTFSNLPEPAISEAVSTILHLSSQSGVKELVKVSALLQSRFSPDFVRAALLDEEYQSPSAEEDGENAGTASVPVQTASQDDADKPKLSSRCSPRVKKAYENMLGIPPPELIDLYLREIADEYDLDIEDPEKEDEVDSDSEKARLGSILSKKSKKASKIADLPLPPGVEKKTSQADDDEDGTKKAKKPGKPKGKPSDNDDDRSVSSRSDSSPDVGSRRYFPSEKTGDNNSQFSVDFDDRRSSDQPEVVDHHRHLDQDLDLSHSPVPPPYTARDSIAKRMEALTIDRTSLAANPVSSSSSAFMSAARPSLGRNLPDYPDVPDEDINPEDLFHSGIEAESVFKIRGDAKNLFPFVPHSSLESVQPGAAVAVGGSGSGSGSGSGKSKVSKLVSEVPGYELSGMPRSTRAAPAPAPESVEWDKPGSPTLSSHAPLTQTTSTISSPSLGSIQDTPELPVGRLALPDADPDTDPDADLEPENGASSADERTFAAVPDEEGSRDGAAAEAGGDKDGSGPGAPARPLAAEKGSAAGKMD